MVVTVDYMCDLPGCGRGAVRFQALWIYFPSLLKLLNFLMLSNILYVNSNVTVTVYRLHLIFIHQI